MKTSSTERTLKTLGSKKGNGHRKTPRVGVFVARYLVHMNGARAAIEAGYSENTAREIASQLLAKPEVQEAVQRAIDARIKRTEITQDKVLRQLWDLANADPNDLVEIRRVCCRYCHGKGHRYQRTQREMQDALKKFERDKLQAAAMGQNFSLEFDAQGGVGYDQRRDSAADCPECCGDGVVEVFIKDSRDLSPQARQLYAGVERSKDGSFKIKMRDQDAALVNVAKHLGMFQTKVVHANDKENPMPASCGLIMIPAKVVVEDDTDSNGMSV